MCEYAKQGFSTYIGVSQFNCNMKSNENCEICVKLAEKVAKEFFKALEEAKHVAIATSTKSK